MTTNEPPRLWLTGTRDQALVALVVEEAHEVVQQGAGFLGRTALQKILYFLKSRGFKMGYGFDVYFYGPFCDEILSDAEALIADEVICDKSDNPRKYSNYAPGPACGEILRLHPDVETLRPEVREVVRTLAPMRPERLELLATLDYLKGWYQVANDTKPLRERVVGRLQELKPGRFPSADVEKAYDDLERARLFRMGEWVNPC